MASSYKAHLGTCAGRSMGRCSEAIMVLQNLVSASRSRTRARRLWLLPQSARVSGTSDYLLKLVLESRCLQACMQHCKHSQCRCQGFLHLTQHICWYDTIDRVRPAWRIICIPSVRCPSPQDNLCSFNDFPFGFLLRAGQSTGLENPSAAQDRSPSKVLSSEAVHIAQAFHVHGQ